MLKAIEYLFYRFYKGQVKGWGEMAHFGALVTTSAVIFLNLLVILMFVKKYTDSSISLLNRKEHAILLFIVVVGFNYFFLLYKNRHKEIIRKYQSESKFSRAKGILLTLTYLLVSVLLVYVVAFYK